ncbi:MAG: Na+/H+ antiporter subunit E [Acetobacteraceae bacterium]
MAAAAAIRFALLGMLWLVLAGGGADGLVLGIAAAALATAVSLVLMPAARLRPRPLACAALLLHLPWAALKAGTLVARLALDPRRRPAPCHVVFRPRLPPGRARDAFLAYASLLPGTLPAGPDASGGIVIHALDGSADVLDSLAEEEARFVHAFGLDD